MRIKMGGARIDEEVRIIWEAQIEEDGWVSIFANSVLYVIFSSTIPLQ